VKLICEAKNHFKIFEYKICIYYIKITLRKIKSEIKFKKYIYFSPCRI